MTCTSTWCIRYSLKARYRLETMFIPRLNHALFWNHGCRVSYRACIVRRETRQELTTEEVWFYSSFLRRAFLLGIKPWNFKLISMLLYSFYMPTPHLNVRPCLDCCLLSRKGKNRFFLKTDNFKYWEFKIHIYAFQWDTLDCTQPWKEWSRMSAFPVLCDPMANWGTAFWDLECGVATPWVQEGVKENESRAGRQEGCGFIFRHYWFYQTSKQTQGGRKIKKTHYQVD